MLAAASTLRLRRVRRRNKRGLGRGERGRFRCAVQAGKRQCAACPSTRDLRAGTRSHRGMIEPPQAVRLDGLCPAAPLPPFCTL